MKLLLSIHLCLACAIGFAQQQNAGDAISKFYEFVMECPMKKCDITGKVRDTIIYIAPPNARFTVVEFKKDECIIRFTLPTKKRARRNTIHNISDFTTYTYYLITRAQLDYKAKLQTRSQFDMVVGNIITPIKIRTVPFDFSKDISVGATFGPKYYFSPSRQSAVDLLVGFGISTVTVDSFSTGTKIKLRQPVDLLALSPSLGLVVEFGSAQIGIFTGLDLISNKNKQQYNWIYFAKPWLSFGIGYSIYSFNIKK